jgi:hypothetical protein
MVNIMSDIAENKKREETRAKLKAFLQNGDSDDVASVLVHTLMHRADVAAEYNKIQEDKKNNKK